jgi:hypothetical protein
MQSPEMPNSTGSGQTTPESGEGHVKDVFVTRLERLLRMRKDYREDLNPLGLRLLDRAIDSTYRDCIDYGAADRARAVMSKHSQKQDSI